jgi:tetratricopeptide (TPR) repeat protein
VWLAEDILNRQEDHRSGSKLSPEAAARQSLGYLDRAKGAHVPTRAFYLLRVRCRKTLGETAACEADERLASKTPPTLALDHYLIGQAAFEAGISYGMGDLGRARQLINEAMGAFEAALLQEPTHYWSLLMLGHCLNDLSERSEDFAGAARVFTGCILKRPDHAHAYWCRGTCYYKLGQLEKAVADFSRAVEIDSTLEEAWSFRGEVYSSMDRHDKAIADFSTAIRLSPTNTSHWRNRGYEYNTLRQYNKAIADFSKTIQLDQRDEGAWYFRGNAYSAIGQYDMAIADYSKAIELYPKFRCAWANRGCVYRDHLGQLEKAVADLSKAIELVAPKSEVTPFDVSNWFKRGDAYAAMGRYDKAIADYSKAIELQPKFARAHNSLAWYLATCADPKLRKPQQALASAKKAVELGPKVGTWWNTLGVAHYRAGNWQEAVEAIQKSMELAKGGDCFDFFFLAMAYSQMGKKAEARKWYEKALKGMEKDNSQSEELCRFRTEAAELLQVKK